MLKKSSLPFILRLLISLTIFAMVFNIVNVKEVASLLKKLNLWMLLVPFVFTLLNLVFAGISFRILLSPFKVKLPLFLMMKYLLYVLAIRSFLPSNLGDLSLVYFLHLEKLPSTDGVLVFFLDKLSSLIIGIVLAIPSMYIFSFKLETSTIAPILLLTFLILALLLFFAKKCNFAEKNIFFNSIISKIKPFIATFSLYFKNHAPILALVLLFTLIRWLLSTFPIYFIFSHLGYTVNFIKILSINALIIALSLLPVTIGGLGIREASAVLLYKKIGLPADVVFSTFLLLLFLNYVFVCIGATIFIFEKRLTFWHKKAPS